MTLFKSFLLDKGQLPIFEPVEGLYTGDSLLLVEAINLPSIKLGEIYI